jgi:hypothetical protein
VTRRQALGALALLVLAIAVVLVGRAEGRSQTDEQVAGIRDIAAVVGPVDAASADAYRLGAELTCFLYAAGGRPRALELCLDGRDRIVEAVDRRAGRRTSSVRLDPNADVPVADAGSVQRVLRRLERQAAVRLWQTANAEVRQCLDKRDRCAASVIALEAMGRGEASASGMDWLPELVAQAAAIARERPRDAPSRLAALDSLVARRLGGG